MKEQKVKKAFYKRIWFWIIVAFVVVAGVNGLGKKDANSSKTTETSTSQSSSSEPTKSSEEKQVSSDVKKDEESLKTAVSKAKDAVTGTTAKTSQTEEEQDQAILDEYTKKISDTTPGLINDYNTKAANNQNGVSGLAELSNEGIGKMATVMYESGSGKQDTYNAYAGKLQDVYMKYGQQITDAYMQSAQ